MQVKLLEERRKQRITVSRATKAKIIADKKKCKEGNPYHPKFSKK